MQIKGAIKLFTILLTLVCVFQLSFTVVTRVVEHKANKYSVSEAIMAQFDSQKSADALQNEKIKDSIISAGKEHYLDSVALLPAYNILIKKYTYSECKNREINLGLDLKGGMNVVMEVAVKDVIEALSHNSQDPTFKKALELATAKQANSQSGYLSLFYEAYKSIDPNAQLAGIFAYEFKDKGITTTSTNDEVYKVLQSETSDAVNRSYRILRTRIDRFGVAQPNIQSIPGTGRISIELPGVKDAARVRKLLQGTASLEFWETHKFSEIYNVFIDANQKLALLEASTAAINPQTVEPTTESIDASNKADSTITELEQALSENIKNEGTNSEDAAKWNRENPLFRYLIPAFYQGQDGRTYPSDNAAVGSAFIKDTATVNALLKKVDLPKNIKLAWSNKPESSQPSMLQLIALKVSNRDGKAPMTGEVITDARQDYDQNGNVEVSMSMNAEPGARLWKNITANNIDRQIAIVLDNYVYSYPVVRSEISGGRSSISGGSMTVEEAQDIATVLKAGKLPAPARIIQEEIVGPSLGQQSIKWGMISFAIAFVLVVFSMVFYYNRSGVVACIALLANVFFLLGILASIGSVLTLPGIAGIVLTIGMAVDANVIIYERIKEELRVGKGIKLAIDEGYKHALSAVIDSNLTTLITAIILYILGTGPVKGFATTLIIGILTSLFTAIFITRLIYNRSLTKKKSIKFDYSYNRNWFLKAKYDFIGNRRIFYLITLAMILAGSISLATRGLSLGIDFAGGRSYVVRFDKDVNTVDIAEALSEPFGSAPEVKTFGPNKQVKITTKYKVDSSNEETENEINKILFENLKPFYTVNITLDDFATENSDKLLGVLTVTKVGPTIAADMRSKSVWAVVFSLLGIFIYIAFRFHRWQYALAGVAGLAHDAFVTISCYSWFYGILPFNLDIDQTFIAAVLTVVGYSITASIVIFDRERENIGLYPKRTFKVNLNTAINSTIARSVMTSFTTLIVLVAILLFGGESIRGMAFSLFVGILTGTYSSVFITSGIVYDLTKNHGDVSKLGKSYQKDEAIMSAELNK